MEGDLKMIRFFFCFFLLLLRMYIIILDHLYAVLNGLIHAHIYYILLNTILKIILNKTLDHHGVLQLGSFYRLVHI